MAIRLMTAVWDDESLPRGDVLLMLALADHANDDGACFPSIGRLARRTRSSPSTVRRHLRSLQAAGRLQVDAREGTSNIYRIAMRGDGWSYGPSQSDTPRILTPLAPGGRGAPSTAVAPRAVTALTPEPSLNGNEPDRVPSLPLGSRLDLAATPVVLASGDEATVRPSPAWTALRAQLAALHPDVAWRTWTTQHDQRAQQQLARLGADAVMRVAARPTRPDLAVAWLTRWEREPAAPPPRPVLRCAQHLVTHHGTCPGCRADLLVAQP